MGITISVQNHIQLVEYVLQELWRYNQSYYFNAGGDHQTPVLIWYVMDEFGIKIRHSRDPTFQTVPFMYASISDDHTLSYITYTLLFPIKEVKFGEEVTRNFVEGLYYNNLSYKAMMLPWKNTDFTMIDFCLKEPNVEFIQSGRVPESLPDFESELLCSPPISSIKLKVYTEYQLMLKYLTHSSFEFVPDKDEADILWLTNHFKEFRQLSQCPLKFINQFPFEHLLTCKNLLAAVCRRTITDFISNENILTTNPSWFPTTYNLTTEICEFISYFQHREKKNLDNTWICKPWNSTRGNDIHITNYLNYILRLPSTGPKIACKYITNPVLFPLSGVGPVKMDIRYIVLLKSIKPLQLYAYKKFWLRFANKPFTMENLDDIEVHFTLWNYTTDGETKQMFCEDFIAAFEEHYCDYKWSEIQDEIFSIFKKIFKAAASNPSPAGMFQLNQCRAMYGIDVMLKWSETDALKIQPVVLEINFSPDCNRACTYYPKFYNDVFEVLFLNKENPNVILL